jgi:hypothetical protein
VQKEISHTPAEIKNLFHLIFAVPLIVILRVRLFNGFRRIIKAIRVPIKGKSIIIKPYIRADT